MLMNLVTEYTYIYNIEIRTKYFSAFIMNRLGDYLVLDQVKVRKRLGSKLSEVNNNILQEMIACADIDNDGRISFYEFKKLMQEPF